MSYQNHMMEIDNTPWGAPSAPSSVTIAGRQGTNHETRQWTYWPRDIDEGDLNPSMRGSRK